MNNIHGLFREYCLSLPKGTVSCNEKDRLFNSLINYWKGVRPVDGEKNYLSVESGVLDDGDMQGLCSLHASTAYALRRFYKDVPEIYGDVYDIAIINARNLFYNSTIAILKDPNSIEYFYPGDNARPIFAACFVNKAACFVAFSIKRTNDEFLSGSSVSAEGYLTAADKLVPNSQDIRSAFHTVDQVRAHIAAKKEGRANESKAHRDEQDKPKKGFFAKLFGL